MDIKQLRSYVAIVDYRNFSKAAAKLNISQASVSTHLLQLEKELGVQLLLRNTQTAEVTQAGWKVYRYARQILEMVDYVHESCTGAGKSLLRVAASAIPAAYMLPEILSRYHEVCAGNELRITQCSDGEVIQGVLEGRFDVGIADCSGDKEGLRIVPIHTDPVVMLLPSGRRYLQMQKKGTDIRKILEEPVIVLDENADRYAERFFEAVGIDTYSLNVVGRVNDLEAVKNMVAKGMGVSVISQLAARDMVKAKQVLQVDLSPFVQGRTISLICPETCTNRQQTWNFMDYVSVSREFSWKRNQS